MRGAAACHFWTATCFTVCCYCCLFAHPDGCADAAHENVTAVVSYRSDLGGVQRTKPVNIVVRFVPSLISLIVALFAGSLTGTLAAQFSIQNYFLTGSIPTSTALRPDSAGSR